jgi:hypothetical protein
MACGDYVNPTKTGGGMMKNTKMKIKLRLKITGRVKASIASMLSPVLTHFAYARTAAASFFRSNQLYV